MSLLKAIKAQLGLSNTPANNFTITAEADNGTLKLARGNAGSTTQDIMTVGASGLVGFPVSKAIETPVKDALNATGSAPVYACRAWVNFNGTGTVAIRASGNVSSITDNGVGIYTVNFTTALPDANYSAVVTCTNRGGSTSPSINNSCGYGSDTTKNTDGTYSTSAVQVMAQHGGGAALDLPTISVSIFR